MHIGRRWAVALAAALMVVLPGAAFWAAPASAGNADQTPGADLAGINTQAIAAAAHVVAYTPNIVPVGNAAKGDFVQVSFPYAESDSSTGPSTTGTAAPAWPGEVAANAGNALQTFAPQIPSALIKLLNDPLAAHSAYPAQVNTRQSGSFAPASSSGADVGTSTTSSGQGGTTSHAVINDVTPLGQTSKSHSLLSLLSPQLKGSLLSLLHGNGLAATVAKSPLVDVGSATADTSSTINAASVTTQATTKVSHVTIAGLIQIDGVSSAANARSDGKAGHQSSDLHVGNVTVAGLAADIGPKGITLNKNALGAGQANLVQVANAVLTALQQGGLSVKTIAPASRVKKNQATVTSGALQIALRDKNVPNLGALLPGLPLPLPSSVGLDVDLGYSQATAAATGQPADSVPPGTGAPPPSTGNTGPSGGIGGGGGSLPGGTGGLPGGSSVTSTPPGGTSPIVAQQAATVLGVPVKVAWVVLAFLLSLVAAGPLLAYANWQLLRGRSS